MAEAGPIENVSDTARWVAMYRALESERPDAHFRDPYARRLAGPRGEEGLLRFIPGGIQMSWPMVVRTCVFDEIALRLARESGLETVLDLAAGFDARPWRMPLPADLSWVDVDLPGILAEKRKVLDGERPACRYRSVELDLRDRPARRRVLADVASGHTRVLVMTEGLLVYLEPDEVAALADDLHAIGARWWLMDISSPALLAMMKRRWGGRLAAAGAPFRFAPAEGTGFFEPHGWREVEYRSTWEEAARLHREMPHAWLWRFLARFAPRSKRETWRRFSGNVLLERLD